MVVINKYSYIYINKKIVSSGRIIGIKSDILYLLKRRLRIPHPYFFIIYVCVRVSSKTLSPFDLHVFYRCLQNAKSLIKKSTENTLDPLGRSHGKKEFYLIELISGTAGW